MGSPAGQISMEEATSRKELLASLESQLRKLDVEMRRVDTAIWALREKMPKPTRGKLGFGKESQPSDTDVENLAEYKKQFEELKLVAEEVSNQITEIRLREQEEEDAMVLIPELIVIAFVNELEKADQYFDVKEHLKEQDTITENSDERDVVKDLLKEETREKFDKLDETIIGHAVAAEILQKRVDNAPEKRRKYIESLKEVDPEKWDWEGRNMNRNTSKPGEDYYNEKDGSWLILELHPEEIDRYAFTHPICYLVLQTRQKHNVMKEDPNEELKKRTWIRRFSIVTSWKIYRETSLKR